MEETSLDEFFESDGEDETDAARSDDGTAADADERDSDSASDGEPARTGEDVAPATTTARWSPSGDTCERCGAGVDRAWRDEGCLVCPDCKDW